MPFTLSHPAAVIPLGQISRLKLSLSALVIGSLIPDFEYLYRLAPVPTVGHSFLGMFYFCLPVGMAVLILFHYILKEPLALLAPDKYRERLMSHYQPFSLLKPLSFTKAALSVLIGAFSHILWDSFTHSYGWAVQRYDFLREPLFTIGGSATPVFRILQHLCGILGIIVIYYWHTRWFRHEKEKGPLAAIKISKKARIVIILALFGGAVAGGWVLGSLQAELTGDFESFRAFFIYAGIGGILVLFNLSLLYAAIIRKLRPEYFKLHKWESRDIM